MTSGHGDRTHAKYGASSASRWLNCYGSTALLASVPARPPSPWAEEGTRAHELLEYALRYKYRDAMQAYIGQTTYMSVGNGEVGPLDEEQLSRVNSVQIALDYIWSLVDMFPDSVLFLEEQIFLKAEPTVGGTVDVAVWWPSQGVLHVIDLKHGQGIAVEITGNDQTRMYATAIVLKKNFHVHKPLVCMTIIQPRLEHVDGHIRHEWTDVDGLLKWYNDALYAVQEGEKPNAPLTAGEKQCRWCEAKTFCPAYEQWRLGSAQMTFENVRMPATLPAPNMLAPERLSTILAAKKGIIEYLEAIEREVYNQMMAGVTIPGWKLVEKQTRRVWLDDHVEVADRLSKLLNKPLDEVYPRKLITITEAQDALKAEFKNSSAKGKVTDDVALAMAMLTTKPSSTGLTLAPDNDHRPALGVTGNTFASVKLPPQKG